MDNINDIISSLSGDDIQMLKNVASSILGSQNTGTDTNKTAEQNNNTQNNQNSSLPAAPAFDIASLLSGASNAKNAAGNADMLSSLNFSKQDFEMMMKAKSLFDRMNNSKNKNVDLIMALRPHLSEKTQNKADQAMRIVRLFEVLPLFKELF